MRCDNWKRSMLLKEDRDSGNKYPVRPPILNILCMPSYPGDLG